MTPAEYNAMQDAIRKAWPATISPKHRYDQRWITNNANTNHSKTVKAVFKALDKPKTVAQIMKKTGLKRQTIAYAISQMMRERVLHVTGRGGLLDPKVYSQAVARLPRARKESQHV